MPKHWQLSKGRIKALIFHLSEESSNATVLIIHQKDLLPHATFLTKDKKHFSFVLLVPLNTKFFYIDSRQANISFLMQQLNRNKPVKRVKPKLSMTK